MNDNVNGNTNDNAGAVPVIVCVTEEPTAEAKPLTLKEVSERLGVTLPRLSRLLKRPEFSHAVTQGERETRTGTRTVTLVSVSVLDALQNALTDTGPEQKREQERPQRSRSYYRSSSPDIGGGNSSGAENEGAEITNGQQLPPLAVMLLNEREARLADKDAEIARLAAALAEAQDALKREQEGRAREQGLRLLEGPRSADSGDTAKDSPAEQPAPWWQQLFGHKK